MSAAFRALLIGVPAYRDDAIDDLPFVTDDMAELEVALTSAGYLVAVHDVKETDRDSIDSAVEEFFQDAAPGDTLLLYLSGHGVHHNGVDYLVPKGALTRSHDFRSRCLSLDFSTYVERSRAGDVAVFVDACREGIVLKEMAAVNAAGWSDMQVDRAGARHYCHVYACSPGERARYTTAGNSTFSIFSRALSSVVISESGPRTLGELKEQLQMAADALTAEHNLPRQQIRVRTETETDAFALFDRPDRDDPGAAGEHAWVAAAREHPAWKQIGDGPGAAEGMREAAISIIAHVAEQTDHDEALLQGDSWRPVGFAERMTGRMGWLLSKVLNPEKLALSPAEAALLVVAPFLYEACANRAAVDMLGADPTNFGATPCPSPARANYEQFVSTRPRLVRRAFSSGKAGATHDIAWWLFRRWLARKPGDFHDQVLEGLLGPLEFMSENVSAGDRKLVAELFELDTLSTLMRSLRTSFDIATVRPERQLAGSTEAEQRIREQLLIVLLIVAHHLAIDPVLLPDVVVEHLDISYSVDMAELHRTIETAVWHPRGRTRVLNAACRHPAVGLALRQQADLLDAVLGSIDVQAGSEPQLAPLKDLPVHATADQVRPAADAQGRPAYESTDLRFRLADDRIQELLMGEQLYGDPALAIRELYQNALDACRYRGARTAYLRRGNAHLAEWSGRVHFVQGVDERGRAYIECTDNGIGMGERELREVFSHAGMRFADLPEYLDEQAAWRDAGIEIHPNSRFGIGVLSYFMIADDISVTTCRLDHEGHPGHRLRVDIAGPGSLFHIRDLGRGHDAFTTVRLYLRSPDDAPSCTDLLRRLLWISEYAVTATDGATRLEWEPGRLSRVAPLGAADPHVESAERAEGATADATSSADVWWTSTTGGVLADGVWMGVSLFGAVVNLTGPYAPQLTVDRRRALAYDRSHVTDLLHREIGALMGPDAEVLEHGWLAELAKHQPPLADAVAEAAVACGFAPWSVHGHEMDITAVGCFPSDVELLSDLDPTDRRFGAQRIPEYIADWRALAWAAAGFFPGVSVAAATSIPLAQPTDGRLLALQRHSRSHYRSVTIRQDEWVRLGQSVPLGHVLWFADLVGRRPEVVAARLMELGLELPEGVVLPETVDSDDLRILSEEIDGQDPWLDSAFVVPLGHVLRAAHRMVRRPEVVAARLVELGLRLPEGVVLPETVDPDDLRILSEDADEERPWLDSAFVVPLGHVLRAAHRMVRRPEVVAARLVELGLRLPEGVVLPETVDPDDL
ncbi:caspase family protein, partial [Streptomyces sp. NPDC012508]|uniref:wHTH domain-containing protein n=1 Tax=Streptomyces sp. NPDC012508 TaxID=3364837 RepID=UPI00368C64B5